MNIDFSVSSEREPEDRRADRDRAPGGVRRRRAGQGVALAQEAALFTYAPTTFLP